MKKLGQAIFILLVGLALHFLLPKQPSTNTPPAYIVVTATPFTLATPPTNSLPQYQPTPTLATEGIKRVVLIPTDSNGSYLASYIAQPSDCIVNVRQSAQGINIYPDLEHIGNDYAIGQLRVDDGVTYASYLMWGPSRLYRWAAISVRGIMGWVHADPSWTAQPTACEAEAYRYISQFELVQSFQSFAYQMPQS